MCKWPLSCRSSSRRCAAPLCFMCDAGELLVFAWNCTSSMNVGSTPSQVNAIGLTVYVFFRNPKPNCVDKCHEEGPEGRTRWQLFKLFLIKFLVAEAMVVGSRKGGLPCRQEENFGSH